MIVKNVKFDLVSGCTIKISKRKTFYIYKYDDKQVKLYITECIQSPDLRMPTKSKNKPYDAYFCPDEIIHSNYINLYIIDEEYNSNQNLPFELINTNCLVYEGKFCIDDDASFVILTERDDYKALHMFEQDKEYEFNQKYKEMNNAKKALDVIKNELKKINTENK